MPGQAGQARRQEAAGAAAPRPQSAVKPGHLGAPHPGGAAEAGGGPAGGGERSSPMGERYPPLSPLNPALTEPGLSPAGPGVLRKGSREAQQSIDCFGCRCRVSR